MALPSMFLSQSDSYVKRTMPLALALPGTFLDSPHVEEEVSPTQGVPSTPPLTGLCFGVYGASHKPLQGMPGRTPASAQLEQKHGWRKWYLGC